MTCHLLSMKVITSTYELIALRIAKKTTTFLHFRNFLIDKC